MIYRNPKLHKAIKSYVIAAIELISGELGNQFPPDDWSEAPEFPFIFSQDNLKQLPEYKKCLTALEDDSIIASQFDTLVGINSRQSRTSQAEELLLRLPHLAIYKNTIKFNDEFFDREYLAFENSFYDTSFDYEVIAPLSGPVFEQPIKISNELEICQVNRNDFSALLVSELSINDRPYFDQPVWAIRTNYKLPKIVGDISLDEKKNEDNEEIRDKANETLAQVLTCLTLLATSNVYPQTIIHRTKSWIFHDVRQYSIKFFPSTQFSMGLDKNFHNDFITFWENYQKYVVDKHKFIALAAKRYSYAHERHDREDRIIDLLIAAEALFLPRSGGQGELKYRLRLNAAIFLENYFNKKQIFEDMSLAYDMRSSIAHGSDNLGNLVKKIKKRGEIDFGEKYKFDQFIYRIQEYIRIAIVKMINIAAENNNQKDLIDWDSLVIGENIERD